MSIRLQIKRLATGQYELSWYGKAGCSYELERSVDLALWEWAETLQGSNSKITRIVSPFGSRGFYRVIEQMPQGSEPETWTVTYLDGSRVEVHWIPFGDPVATGQYQIKRNGILIGVVTGDSDYFVDDNVQSGQTYVYTVGYFS